MIVADTNIIAYLYLPTAQTEVAPLRWRNKFRNVLALYVRKNIIDLNTAIAMQSLAEQQLTENEYAANSIDVLTLASQSGCSAYDCEFVSVARALNLKLITGDKKLVQLFPGIAMTAGDYLRTALR